MKSKIIKSKIKIAVIPAAGVGHRLGELPLTRVLPKPMLPILHKPILEHIIEKIKNDGIENIFIIVGHKRKIIEDYFQDGKAFGIKIKYIFNKKAAETGIADSIYLAKKFIKEPFFVILGDDFTLISSLSPLRKKFFKEKALVVEAVVFDKNLQSLKRTNCLCLEQNGKIKTIVEKPKKPEFRFRGCGIYIFHPDVFRFIEKTPVCSLRPGRDITTTIQLMAQKGKAYGVLIDGINININTFSDFKMATDYALKFSKIKISCSLI